MPLFQVDIEKLIRGEYHTNRYVVNAADLGAATTAGGSIVAAEKAFFSTSTVFTKWRVSDMVQGTDVYVTIQDGGSGSVAASGNPLPLWNVVRVDFNTGSGRPSRKYLRADIRVDDVAANAQLATGIGTRASTYAQALLNIPEFVDVDGQAFVSGQVYPFIAMHQLRRGSRRRTEPVLP